MKPSESLNESLIIQKIRQCGLQIFNLESETSFQYSLSDEQPNIEERLEPFIKCIIPSMNKKKQQQRKKQYANSYISPYSQKQNTQRLSTSRSLHKQNPIEMKSIRKKIFNFYNEEQQIQARKKQLKKLSHNKKYETSKPKYMQRQPIMNQYMSTNLYQRLKTDMDHMEHMRNQKTPTKQGQAKWQQFLKNTNERQFARQSSLIKARICKNMKDNQQPKAKPIKRTPPKMTVDQCLQKLRRHAEKLKQKLNMHSFTPVLYETQRKRYKLSKEKAKKSNPQSPQKGKYTIIQNPVRQLDFMFH